MKIKCPHCEKEIGTAIIVPQDQSQIIGDECSPIGKIDYSNPPWIKCSCGKMVQGFVTECPECEINMRRGD